MRKEGFSSADPYAPRILPNGKVASRLTSFTVRGTRLSPGLDEIMAAHGSAYELEIPRAAGWTTVAPDYEFHFADVFGLSSASSDADASGFNSFCRAGGADSTVSAMPFSGRNVLEIGSGMGDQAVSWCLQNPHDNLLALEVWDEGRAQTVQKAVEAGGLPNLRLVLADASIFLSHMDAGSADEVWTFFPDPWRKARHHRRRLVQEKFAAAVYRVLKPGGVWRLATDWENYAAHMARVLAQSAFCSSLNSDVKPDQPAGSPELSGAVRTNAELTDAAIIELCAFKTVRWPERIITKFEKKGMRAGRQIYDFAAYKPLVETAVSQAEKTATAAQNIAQTRTAKEQTSETACVKNDRNQTSAPKETC